MPIILFILLLLTPLTGHAYVGPGMGAGAIGVVFGLLASFFLALVAILWFPIKRMLKKKKKSDAPPQP